MQKVEGNVTFHTARSTAFPQPAPGTAPSPGPMKVEDARLRSLLGVASINFKAEQSTAGDHRYAAARLRKMAMRLIHRRDFGALVAAAALLRAGATRAEEASEPVGGPHRQFRVRAGAAHGEGRPDRHMDQPG